MRQMSNRSPSIELIGKSKAIVEVHHLIEQVANTQANVLILGESGTGKELVARLVHAHSSRHDKPFIPVNCAAIPLELLESELFGHEKGSFTGAYVTRQGRFEMATLGTIFLDEIGDMPLPMQAKLLRVLQERLFERVGSNKSIETNARVIAATHKNLEEGIKEGSFREDLYYRLNVFPIEIPSLRSRPEDIEVLIHHFLKQFQAREGKELTLSVAALTLLQQYEWPGNVRELANLVERWVIQFGGREINVCDLPEKFHLNSGKNENNSMESENNLDSIKLLREGKDFTILTSNELPKENFDLKEYLTQLELTLINQALTESKGIVSRAAKRLGLRRTTLVEKLRKFRSQNLPRASA